jgi:hypothetical protein
MIKSASPSDKEPTVTPEPEKELEKAVPTVETTAPKKKFSLAAYKGKILVALVILAVGVAAYFVANLINTPVRIKEQVVPTHVMFVDYDQKVDKVIEDLLAENNNTSVDALERAVKKSEDYLEEAEEHQEKLEAGVQTLTIGQTRGYREAVEKYLEESNKAIEAEKQAVDLGKAYLSPIKKYKDLETKISGSSAYTFSNPNKYSDELEKFIKEHEDILNEFKNIQVGDQVKDLNDMMIKRMEDELNFIKDTKKAIDERDVELIANAQQTYAEKSKSQTEDSERVTDEFNDRIEDIQDSLQDLRKKVEAEHSTLQAKYKF